MKTWAPQQAPIRLSLCGPEEVVYYPVGREEWVLLRWDEQTSTEMGTKIRCEAIAGSEGNYRLGRSFILEPWTEVYQLNEMEVLALAST